MKVRSGFVSNSSSSSFIVAVDKKSTTKITLTFEIDLKNYADSNGIISTREELLGHLNHNWCIDFTDQRDIEGYGRMYKKYLKACEELDKGKQIIFGMFSDEGSSGIETMLCMEGLEGKVDDNVVVIESEGGY